MIFGIGLSKTGTTSLWGALAQLGFRSGTYGQLRRLGLESWFRGDFSPDYLQGYEAVTDLPIGTYFVELDKRYPGSKFVLTVRDETTWLDSAERHFSTSPQSSFGRAVRLATYGITQFERDRFRRVYEAHVSEVLSYFEHRAHDLLVLDIVGGEGWEKLCPFVSRDTPSASFPHIIPSRSSPTRYRRFRAALGRTYRAASFREAPSRPPR